MALHQTPSPMGTPGAGVTQGLFYGVPEGACAGAPTAMVLSGGGSVSPPNPSILQAMGHCEGSSMSPISSW